MALKLRIREKCERCGQRGARKIGDRVVLLAHHCPKGPPGPPSAPHIYSASEVVFEPSEFDPAFLQKELDEAWVIIDDLRHKRWKAEEQVKDAVKKAMAAVYDPGRPVPHHGSGS